MQALVVQCVLEQQVGQRVCAQSDQTTVEIAPGRSNESVAGLIGLREPSEADGDAVLTEQAVPADRAGTPANELVARYLEPYAVTLRPLHSCADRRLVPLERSNRAEARVVVPPWSSGG
jgi:hypothetical protein